MKTMPGTWFKLKRYATSLNLSRSRVPGNLSEPPPVLSASNTTRSRYFRLDFCPKRRLSLRSNASNNEVSAAPTQCYRTFHVRYAQASTITTTVVSPFTLLLRFRTSSVIRRIYTAPQPTSTSAPIHILKAPHLRTRTKPGRRNAAHCHAVFLSPRPLDRWIVEDGSKSTWRSI
jgi:hypothetical protein